MSIAIGTFIEMEEKYYFQNFFVNEVREWEGQKYQFAGFGYGGASSDLQGGNIDAAAGLQGQRAITEHGK